MTTEQKAKAYDEAIERAKKLQHDNSWVTSIFPELKESDDEKIRKSIVSIINQYARMCEKEGDPCEASLVEDALAYLEKQKEQKPVEWSEDFQENIRILLHNKLTWHSDDGKMSSAVLIDNETLKDIISGIWFYVGKEALKYPNKELNVSEWSEEDETALGDLMWCIEQARKSAKNENDMGNIWFAENWVKKRIKSLRPQSRWKPSEEQMEVLRRYVSGKWKGITIEQDKQLSLLYNDLKKLM